MPDTLRWSEMSPEQRDALIHEKVMGKRLICGGTIEFSEHDVPNRAGGVAFTMTIWTCQRCGEVGAGKPPECHEKLVPLPHYTTDMNAAWQVLQHALDQGRGYASMTLYHRHAGEQDKDGYLEIDMHLQDEYQYLPPVHVEDHRLSGAEVICLAALRAVGVTIE